MMYWDVMEWEIIGDDVLGYTGIYNQPYTIIYCFLGSEKWAIPCPKSGNVNKWSEYIGKHHALPPEIFRTTAPGMPPDCRRRRWPSRAKAFRSSTPDLPSLTRPLGEFFYLRVFFLLRDVWLYVGLYLYHWVLTMIDDFGRILDFVWLFLTVSDYCWLIYFWLYNFDMLWPFNGLSFHSRLDTRWYKVVISWAMCSV